MGGLWESQGDLYYPLPRTQASLPYPKQESIRARELVVPDGLVHDEHTAQECHGEGNHPGCGQLREGKENSLIDVGPKSPSSGAS